MRDAVFGIGGTRPMGILTPMESANRKPTGALRKGWTTGACATAGVKAALIALWSGEFPAAIQITLPRGETPVFPLAHHAKGNGWAEVGITKDAGDDPDVTHGALIIARVAVADAMEFHAGNGVGIVTKPGLPIDVGQAAINPVPRQMMTDVVHEVAEQFNKPPFAKITISVPGGQDLALKTWNPRLGIEGGISILGTTGVVRPFSCAAWIASIHRGIDVARADGLRHVAGCTGATSEKVVQGKFNLPDHAMLDMGDFAGGLLKYLARHPVDRITLGGGIGKMTKFAQGAIDLHSSRSQVDFADLATRFDTPELVSANTALQAYEMIGAPLAQWAAAGAKQTAERVLKDAPVAVDVVVIDRHGTVLATA